MSIKCHSSFVHYNMFHDKHNHCGGNNFGSIFNITNNCNGGHTGFWGGFGAGLGYGLGNWFGGFMGGMGNMFSGFGMNMFGGFGMNIFGGFGNMFGGFGMNMFGGSNYGLGSLFGGGNKERDYSEYSSRHSRRSSTCDCGCKGKKDTKPDPTDKDCKKIADFQKEINDLTQPITEEKYNDIKTRIQAARTESEKDIKNKDNNLKSYDELLGALEKAKNGNNLVQEPENEIGTEESPKTEINNKQISQLTDDDIAGITNDDYSNLDDEAKNDVKNKIYSLARSNRDKAEEWARSRTLPSDLRAEAKRSFYEEGYTNVTLDELTDEEIKKLETVIDTSEVADFTNIKEITDITRESGKLKSFKMTAESGTSVTYVTVSVVDGELIFHGDKDDQEYVLQKDSNGKYHLMQYEYHKGNGTPDVIDN